MLKHIHNVVACSLTMANFLCKLNGRDMQVLQFLTKRSCVHICCCSAFTSPPGWEIRTCCHSSCCEAERCLSKTECRAKPSNGSNLWPEIRFPNIMESELRPFCTAVVCT